MGPVVLTPGAEPGSIWQFNVSTVCRCDNGSTIKHLAGGMLGRLATTSSLFPLQSRSVRQEVVAQMTLKGNGIHKE